MQHYIPGYLRATCNAPFKVLDSVPRLLTHHFILSEFGALLIYCMRLETSSQEKNENASGESYVEFYFFDGLT